MPFLMVLILVSWNRPHRLDYPVRWQWGDRLILGPGSPSLSTALLLPIH